MIVAIAVGGVVIVLLVVLIIVHRRRREALAYRKREAILCHEAMSRPTIRAVSSTNTLQYHLGSSLLMHKLDN